MNGLINDIITVLAAIITLAPGVCALLAIIGLATVKNEDNIKI